MTWEKAAESIHRILAWAGHYGQDNDDMAQGLIVEGLQKGWTPREATRRVLIKKIGPGGTHSLRPVPSLEGSVLVRPFPGPVRSVRARGFSLPLMRLPWFT